MREWHYAPGAVSLKKGEEMGRFMLGSTVVLLFPEGDLRFEPKWHPGGPVRLGEPMAELGSGRIAAMRAVFVDANAPLRGLAEAIGPATLPSLELAFGDADIAPDALPAALAGAPIAVIDHTALPLDVARAARACATSSSSASARAATWTPRRSPRSASPST